MKKLGIQFYAQGNVLAIARELSGKAIVTHIGGHTPIAYILRGTRMVVGIPNDKIFFQ